MKEPSVQVIIRTRTHISHRLVHLPFYNQKMQAKIIETYHLIDFVFSFLSIFYHHICFENRFYPEAAERTCVGSVFWAGVFSSWKLRYCITFSPKTKHASPEETNLIKYISCYSCSTVLEREYSPLCQDKFELFNYQTDESIWIDNS